MNPTIPARVEARDRHDTRLQSMTIGAAALGIAATGFFGYAAALTYAGTTTAAQNAVTQPQPVQQQPLTNSFGGDDGQGSQGGLVNPYYNQQQPVTPPTITRQHSHAISGGS